MTDSRKTASPKKGKPFVVYKRAAGHFTIMPRGLSGWLQFTAWLVPLGALALWFASHLEANPDGPDFGGGAFLFCAGLIGWLAGLLWWMLERAEVVDVVVLERDRRMAERKRQRRQ